MTRQQVSAVVQAMMELLAQAVGKALIVSSSVKKEDGDQTVLLNVAAVSMVLRVTERPVNVTFVRLDIFCLYVRNRAALINGEKTASIRAFVAMMNPAIGKRVLVPMTSALRDTRGSLVTRRVSMEHGDQTVMERVVLV